MKGYMYNETEQYQAKAEASGIKTNHMPLSPKPWKNKSIEEKLESLRESQQDIRRSLHYTANDAQRAKEAAYKHEHSAHTGEVVLAPSKLENRDNDCGSSYDPLA
jgi:hypothetical protein